MFGHVQMHWENDQMSQKMVQCFANTMIIKKKKDVDGCFSFCLLHFIGWTKFNFFSQKQKYFSVEDKLLPGHKHGFLRSEENFNLIKFNT